MAPSSKRIVEDCFKVMKAFEEVVKSKGVVKGHPGHRYITGGQRSENLGGHRERKQPENFYGDFLIHKDALKGVHVKLETSRKNFNKDHVSCYYACEQLDLNTEEVGGGQSSTLMLILIM